MPHLACTSKRCYMAKIAPYNRKCFSSVAVPLPVSPMLLVPSRVSRTLLGCRPILALMAPLGLEGPRCLAARLPRTRLLRLTAPLNCDRCMLFPSRCTNTKLTHVAQPHRPGFQDAQANLMNSMLQYAGRNCCQ
jgi:hypothetical protein